MMRPRLREDKQVDLNTVLPVQEPTFTHASSVVREPRGQGSLDRLVRFSTPLLTSRVALCSRISFSVSVPLVVWVMKVPTAEDALGILNESWPKLRCMVSRDEQPFLFSIMISFSLCF